MLKPQSPRSAEQQQRAHAAAFLYTSAQEIDAVTTVLALARVDRSLCSSEAQGEVQRRS
jgi:hypothetical protein